MPNLNEVGLFQVSNDPQLGILFAMGHDRLERLHVNSASLSVTLRTLGFLQHSDLDTTLDNIFAHQGRRSIAREEDLEFQPALRFSITGMLHDSLFSVKAKYQTSSAA